MQISVHEINRRLAQERETFIAQADRRYRDAILAVAEDIWQNRLERPIVLLSGPSGSGKTTTAQNIERILDARGCETHTLSMDDYFHSLTPEQIALAAEGKFDLESPSRVDAELLSEQLEQMVQCRPVQLPRYDFVASRRVYDGRALTRKPNELVIVEGIHALNPDVVQLPDDETVRIYISVRTRVEYQGKLLHPSRVRLLRRMIRDELFRDRSLRETRVKFDSVEQGEQRYIMPYKHRADHELDTFIDYEPGVYRCRLLAELEAEDQNDPLIAELVGVLRSVDPLPPGHVPCDSLIREFIGDGCFAY